MFREFDYVVSTILGHVLLWTTYFVEFGNILLSFSKIRITFIGKSISFKVFMDSIFLWLWFFYCYLYIYMFIYFLWSCRLPSPRWLLPSIIATNHVQWFTEMYSSDCLKHCMHCFSYQTDILWDDCKQCFWYIMRAKNRIV